MEITRDIIYAGVNDHSVDLFEGQYKVPNGMCYNSYVICDEKCAVMDTVDARFTHEWLDNLSGILKGKAPDYLIIQHMEPDHSANIYNFMKNYPNTTIVSNAKAFAMMGQFFDMDLTDRMVVVKEGDSLSLGTHTLTFVMAPMVHWPEVMVAYDQKDRLLFSADGFGKFGGLKDDLFGVQNWDDEARRYYINIVGKYGVQVQALLKKAAALDIAMICPLHGPVLRGDLSRYLEKYQIWSSYAPEEDGVLIACASIHGNTMRAARKLADILREKGAAKVVVADLARDDMAAAVSDAFRFDKLVLAGATYNAEVFPCMQAFLSHLKGKNYQNRAVGIMENGTWAPMAAKVMRAALEGMKGIRLCEQMVSLKSAMKQTDLPAMGALAEELLQK